MKRIYSLDFLKLYFAYVVAFFHFGTDIPPGTTVAVQVFFIVSGFFLGKKYYARSHGDRGASYDQWNYTLDHVKSLYPHYILSLLVFLAYVLTRAAVHFVLNPSWEKLADMAYEIYNQIPAVFLLQSAYKFHDSLNYPVWQISALVIASYFVYGLLCWDEKKARKLVFPAAILMTLSILETGIDLFGNFGPFYIPLLRAFAPLCVGVLTYYFTMLPAFEKWKQKKIRFNLASVLSLLGIIVYADHAAIFMITTPVLILACYEETSWINAVLNKKAFRNFGNFSYAIYLNHALIARIVEAVLMPRLSLARWQENLLYFVLLTAYSVVTLTLVETWKKRNKKDT